MGLPIRVFVVFFAVFALTVSALGQGTVAAQKSVAIVFNDGHRQNLPISEIDRIDFKSAPVVVFKDGHRQSLPIADAARIEFPSFSKDSPIGRNYFVGKWKVGVETMAGHFFITLQPNGEARKSMGASHGTWTVVGGEARISWDDGWHDAIRKVGSKHEKRAFAPGKTFSDEPSNVTDAINTTAEPI
jgi:hypothetical protein